MASIKMLIRRRSSAVDQYIENLRHNTSKGDVRTLRTQLHTRRAELNEQIEREDRIADGSRKLFGVSNDSKTKNQASLEMSFSESKIKSLQAELAKINSSLSAYQAEGCETSQVPLIPVAFKVTHKMSFEQAFNDICTVHYHTPSSEVKDTIQEFEQLRQTMSTVSRDENGLRALFEYHSHLQLVAKRFIHPNFKHGLSFIWYDAINGLPYQQQTAVFERACVLFNIGALYSQLAANVDRESTDGPTEAVKLLEKSAGVFEYIRDKFANPPSRDLSPDMLAMLADLMRAQAQELLWDAFMPLGETTDEHIDCAHKTKCVADCYSPVREFMERSEVKGYLPECWVTLVKVKEAHFKALAHYHTAMAHKLVATELSESGSISENLRTELHFLYIESPTELNTNQSDIHIGLMKSHLNSATLSHEFAIKFNSLCRDLHHVTPLTRMLSEASLVTQMSKAEADKLTGDSMTLPTIQASAVEVTSQPPKPSSIKVTDLFQVLGPLPVFSGDNRWSAPRIVTLSNGEEGLGLSIKKSRPVLISNVQQSGIAELAGVRDGDWIVQVNGHNVLTLAHEQVVQMIKSCKDSVTLQLITPHT